MRTQLALVLLLNLTGCAATPRPVDVPEPGDTPSTTEVSVGARVRIEKMDGSVIEFKVWQVSDTGLKGVFGLMPYSDMRTLGVLKQSSNGIWIVFGVLGLVLEGAFSLFPLEPQN